MTITWHRYARRHEVQDYLRMGWNPSPALVGTRHEQYAVLVNWVCRCPVPDLIGNKALKFAAAQEDGE